jgi:two-component system sensor histidine kinase VicK
MRGESAIASSGLLLAVIVLCAMGGSAWWSTRSQQHAMDDAHRVNVDAVGALLVETVETRLTHDEVSAVRHLVASTGRSHGFETCRVVLPDGQVIAAISTADITLAALPPTWDGTPDALAAVPAPPSPISVATPFEVPGRGFARLDIGDGAVTASWGVWDAQAGIGLMAAAALAAILVVYRRMRSRMRALSYIRESLIAIDGGETSLAALTVQDDLGVEAMAWNELIAERERLQQVLVTKRMLELPAAREERSQDLTNMCDAMSQGLVLVDKDLCITYANGAAGLYLGRAREEILATSIETSLDDDRVLETVRQVASGALRRSTSLEVEQGAVANAVLRFSVRPLRSDDDSAAMIVVEDVTQQRLADDSRSTFVAQVTHELRTPLTNILLYTETAMDETLADTREKQKALNVISQEAQRLERIVSDMLSVAELEAGAHEVRSDDVPLASIFGEMVNDYEAAARERNIELRFDLAPNLPTIQGDRDKIVLAVHNLVGNALKYTPEGGHVEVTVECDDTALTVAVKDDGIGMEASQLERVFEKFCRADDERIAGITGSGLGLALAREVIRMHGGDITVESELDEGSTFLLTVPVHAHAA